jgi:hypothetical protein
MHSQKTFDFSDALRMMREGIAMTRLAWNNKSIKVMVQVPDEDSKMTEPYLYMEKEGVMDTKRFPLDLSAESIFAEDWVEFHEQQGVEVDD